MSAQSNPQFQNPMQAVLAARVAQQRRELDQKQSAAANVVAIKSVNSNLTASAAAALSPSGQIAEWFQSLTRATSSHRDTMVEIAYYGRLLRDADSWETLGFRDEDHARQHLGYAESTWNNYLALGERLRQLTLEEMRQLTQSAARLLTQIHPRLWDEFAWVEEAKALPARDFQLLVQSRNQQVSAVALAEPKSSITVQVPISQRQSVERRIESIRRQHKLPSSAATLNHILRTAESQPELVTRLTTLESEIAELAVLWQPDAPWSTNLQESESEQAARFDGSSTPSTLTEAAIQSQRLVKRLLRSLESVHAVLPKEG